MTRKDSWKQITSSCCWIRDFSLLGEFKNMFSIQPTEDSWKKTCIFSNHKLSFLEKKKTTPTLLVRLCCEVQPQNSTQRKINETTPLKKPGPAMDSVGSHRVPDRLENRLLLTPAGSWLKGSWPGDINTSRTKQKDNDMPYVKNTWHSPKKGRLVKGP